MWYAPHSTPDPISSPSPSPNPNQLAIVLFALPILSWLGLELGLRSDPNPYPNPNQLAIVLSALPILSGAVVVDPEGDAGWITDTIREHRSLPLPLTLIKALFPSPDPTR